MIFGYVIAANMTVMSINFLRNQWVLEKLQPNSFNIAPIELKLGLWVKGGLVNIPTKFQVNLRILDFFEIYALCCIFYFYGSEMYRLYRTKLYCPV